MCPAELPQVFFFSHVGFPTCILVSVCAHLPQAFLAEGKVNTKYEGVVGWQGS